MCEPGDVILLELSPFGLVAGRVGVGGFARKVEFVFWSVAAVVFADNDDPRLFASVSGVEELELGVGDAAVVGVYLRRFGAVAVSDELNEPLAGVDLLPQPLSQFAVAGGKVVLRDRVKAEVAYRGGDLLAGGPQLLADG